MVGVVISAKMRRTLIWHDRQWRQRWWRQVRRWQRSFCWVRCNWYFCFGSTWWRLQVWSGIYRYVSSSGFICHANNFLGAKSLGESDLDLLCIYTLKVEDHLSEHTFNRLSKVFPNNNHNTLKMMKKCIQFLSGFQPVQYSCCINSCVCFVGPYEDLTKCPNCQKAWYTAKGKPQKSFNYLPLIPWLRAMLTNSSLAKKMRYQAEHDHEPTVIKDVFDSNHYQSLLHTIVPAEKDHPFFYFSDEHDIALGLSTDGFAPFKQCDKTCWPVEIFNYNLSPEIHFLKNHYIPLFTIPGPKKPWDWDSFCWLLIQELIQLEIGVKAFNAISQTFFFTSCIPHPHLWRYPCCGPCNAYERAEWFKPLSNMQHQRDLSLSYLLCPPLIR